MRDLGVFFRSLALSVPLIATAATTAQRLDIPRETQRVIAIDGLCRFHPGDDPDGKLGWAVATFDDSAWQTMDRWPTVQSREPNFWLRCRFNPGLVSPDIQPILQVSGDFSYQLFLDGHFLGGFGNILNGRHTAGLVHQYSAAELSDRAHPFLIALRITVYPTNYDLQPIPTLTLGPSAVLRDQYTARVARAVSAKSVIWLSYIVIAGAGLFFLALYLFDRSQVMLLWVSITWLFLALIRLSEFLVTASIPIPSVFEYLCYSVGDTNGIAIILFFFAIAARPVTPLFRIIAILSLATTAPLILVPLFPLHQAMALRWVLEASPQFAVLAISASCLLCLAPLFAFWPLNKISRDQIPIFLAGSFWMLINFLYMGMQFPGLPFAASEYLKLQPIRSVAMALAAVVMTLLLIQRIRATNRQRALFAGELQAPRDIQRLLVPAHIDSAPWLHLQAAFLPAHEVGGDFYRCRMLPDRSQWILLGDVSGKGTAAAMTGAMLLGAAEGRESEPPATLLGHLNSALCCSRIAGFVTCLVLRISPSGTLTVAFLWQIHRLRSRFFGLLCVLALLHFNLCELVLQTDPHASLLVAFANLSWVYSLHIFNFVSIGANLCALYLAGRNRFIAVALALIPAASEIQHAAIKHGHDIQVGIGPLKIDPFNLAFLIASIVLFAVLFRRAWSAWRAREDLRAEFDSAREMQQLLVTPAADLPGFSIQSAYLPARDVGGDFFHVSQQPAGAVLVVIGDVSGKGLRAAMTVSAIMGALRTVPGTQALSPAAILAHLNLGLAGHMGGGFVTACAACLSPQGRLTLANAGHLAPYANGLELPIDSGLPLGILPDTTYAESIADLAPNASLTFLSDGVLEARNAAGELFGFERTSAISTQSAGQIAAAAQAFGQEDDITVLTLTFAPAPSRAEVLHA